MRKMTTTYRETEQVKCCTCGKVFDADEVIERERSFDGEYWGVPFVQRYAVDICPYCGDECSIGEFYPDDDDDGEEEE